MKRVILFGHTGSMNRGCDAIIKSTADLIHRADPDIEVVLVTNRKSEDGLFGFDEFNKVVETVGFENAPVRRCIMIAIKKLAKNSRLPYKIKYSPLNKHLDDAIVLAVGGDVYCYGYGIPPQYQYIVDKCEDKNIPCILWACSVERDRLDNDILVEHFKKYDYILAREQETMANFIDAGFEASGVKKMSDPAFTLTAADVRGIDEDDLPVRDSIGINISSVTLNWSNSKELLLKNVYAVIDYVLGQTGMDVHLIPHVYPAKKDGPVRQKLYGTKRVQSDLELLRDIYNRYSKDKRVHIVDGLYNSKQLKYIISKCKILITARTHASIAAYSSCVPTIVIGYSVKAYGLAKDIFGTTENFVVDNTKITDDKVLLKSLEYVLENYSAIKDRLEQVIPGYQAQAADAVEFLLKKYN